MRSFTRGARLPFLAALLPFAVCATFFACDDAEVSTPSRASSPEAPPVSDPSAPITTGEMPPPDETTPPETDGNDDHEHDVPLALTITSPADGAVVVLPPSGELPITFETNLEMQKPKTCTTAGHSKHCGHAHVTIDGAACNAPRPGPGGGMGKQAFNITAEHSSSTYADFKFCPQPVDGPHVIELELRQDNHAPLNPVVKRSITVTVSSPEGGFPRDAGAD